MENYSFLGRVGEGAHGIVFKAKQIQSGEIVALKKVPLRRLEDGIPNTALREIKALQQIEHPNVVKLYDVFSHGTGFVLVFEYMLSDLSEVLRNYDDPLTQSQIKSYMLMLLQVRSREQGVEGSWGARWGQNGEKLGKLGARCLQRGVSLAAVGKAAGKGWV